MDTRGGSWENDSRESQERLNDGNERTHQYYCPSSVGGICSCSVEENNNEYANQKKSSKSRKASKCSRSFCDGQSQYDSHSNSSDSSYSCCSSSCQQPASYPTSSGLSQQPNGESSCKYCQYNVSSDNYCSECNVQQNNATYCDYYDPCKTYGSASYAVPKIQVTAKILFGTVSAITNMKQKKSTKKS